MKILAISGSPRKGNTEIMLERALEGAKEAGADIELVLLRELDIKMCSGCHLCPQTKKCHIQDDLQGIYGKVFAADAIILGSPNYFNNVSGTMKNFMDRFDPFWEDKRLKGKRIGLVSVGGQKMESIQKCENALKEFCRICKMKVIATVKARADKKGEILENKKALDECFELGKTMVK